MLLIAHVVGPAASSAFQSGIRSINADTITLFLQPGRLRARSSRASWSASASVDGKTLEQPRDRRHARSADGPHLFRPRGTHRHAQRRPASASLRRAVAPPLQGRWQRLGDRVPDLRLRSRQSEAVQRRRLAPNVRAQHRRADLAHPERRALPEQTLRPPERTRRPDDRLALRGGLRSLGGGLRRRSVARTAAPPVRRCCSA